MKAKGFAILGTLTAVVAGIFLSAQVDAKKTKLVIWTNGWPTQYTAPAYKMFEKENPNVTVEVLVQIDRAKLLFAIATGTAPDLITLVTPIAELSDRGLLTPLNSYLKTSRTIKEGDYNPALLDIFSTAGKLYGLPSIEVGQWTGLIYNKQSFEESGLDPDIPARTLEELQVVHRKLTKFQNGVMTKLGMNPTGSMGSIYFPETWGQIFGAKTVDKKTGRIYFDTPEMLRAVEYNNSFFDSFTPQQFSAWWGKSGGDWGASIGKGTQAMELNGYWTPGQVAIANPKAKIASYWMPNVKGDKMMAYGGWSLCIPKGSKNPDLAFKFMEFMTTKAPAQFIFDKQGFLNGNRRSIRELDFSLHPETKWFLQAMETADRITTTSDVPMWDKCARDYLWNGVADVCHRKKLSPASMLRNVQKQVDIELDKYYKKVKK